MEKTEMMKRYEEKTGKQAIYWTAFGPEISQEYLERLEAKAEAYDRLMSGGKKTPKEVANFLGKPIAMDRVGIWYEHKSKPSIGEGYCEFMWVSGLTGNAFVRSISVQIDFTGNWKDSLTLPDGWEEA